jgi:hypothetical protein
VVYVYANTTLNPFTNGTYDISQGVNWANRDDSVKVSATLAFDNGSIISGKNITFYDSTSNIYLGSALTNSTGTASIQYNISSSATLGYHTINASFAGDPAIYAWGSFNITTLDIRTRPQITGITITPGVIGYGYNTTIQATVTDDKQVDRVMMNLTYPNGTTTLIQMGNIPPSTYLTTFNFTWQYGRYNFTLIANDTDGAISNTTTYSFNVSVSSIMTIKTLNDSYSSNQYVNLTPVPSSWLDSSWKYRKQANLTNTAGTLSDYQVLTSINLSSAYQLGHINSDCSDVRFSFYNLTSRTETSIPFWIESCNLNTSDTATFWAKVPYIQSSALIYAYYGNPSASSASNGTGTFNIFDDFLGSSVDTNIWQVDSSSYSVGNSSLRINIGAVSSKNALSFNLNSGYILEAKMYYHQTSANYGGTLSAVSSHYTGGGNSGADATSLYMRDTSSTSVTRYTGSGSSAGYDCGAGAVWTSSNDVWYIHGTKFNSTGLTYTRDRTTEFTPIACAWTKNLNYISLGYFSGAGGDNQDTSYDWVLVRKYNGPDPSASIGAEEHAGSVISNSGSTNFTGCLIMKVQTNISGSWQDVATIINDVSAGRLRTVGSSGLNLTEIWNNISWYTATQSAGTYRAYAELDSPYGNVLYGGNSYLNATSIFVIAQPALLLNISNIEIYDVTSTAPGNRHFYTNEFIDSGTNKTFNLYKDKLYRIEITVSDIGSQNWPINTTNITYFGLNPNWIVSPSSDIWYSNKTLIDDKRTESGFTGGIWTGGNATWNTTSLGGNVVAGRNATFFFILNITQAGDVQANFMVSHSTFARNDYSTYHIVEFDTQPPRLYNNIYNFTNDSIERGGLTTVYARWTETIAQANATYTTTTNTTWVYVSNSSPQNPQNWTNFSIQTSTTWYLGVHQAKISAEDESGNWNTTLPYINFTVWGRAQVTDGNLNSTQITQNGSVRIACLVTDFTSTNSPIQNYTVSFYNSTSLLGNSSTNSTGWATYDYLDRTIGNETLTCNITSSAQMFYHIDSSNYRSFSMVTMESIPPYYTTITGPAIVHKTDTVVFSTYWHDNYQLGSATLGVNTSGSWSNYSTISLSSTDAYANFTYQIPAGMATGYMQWMQFANDSFGNRNQTPVQSVEVWGWAAVVSATASPASIQVTNTSSLQCLINDANTSTPLTNYNVTFWMKNSTMSSYQYLGSNLTGASGWANFSRAYATADTYTLLCNITHNASMRYNASAANTGTATLNVVSGSDATPPYILGTSYQINSTSINRGECIKLSAQWNEQINLSWMDYDPLSIGSYLTSNLSSPYTGNWTNTTICTNSTWQPGNHSLKLYARDMAGNVNNTAPYKYFVVWGRAQLTFQSPSGNQDRGVISLFCNVSDVDTGAGINNYSVTFYDGVLGYSIGSNLTNSSGIAKLTYNYSSHWVGPDQLSCVIADNNAIYYKVYGSTTAYSTITLYGTLYANISNPTYNSIVYRGGSLSLNSSVLDEMGISPKDDTGANAVITAIWFNDTYQQIASGSNTVWAIPNGYTLGPDNLTLNVSSNYYHNGTAWVNITVYGSSNVTWVAPPTGYYRNLILNLTCLVRDNQSGGAISGYQVEFFDDATSLGFSSTNSSGHAVKQFNTGTATEGNHSLKCVIYDNTTIYYTKSGVYQANMTAIIDRTLPAISYNQNTDASGSYSRNWTFINITAQDPNLDRVLLFWNGTSQNFTNSSASLYWITKTDLADGIYTFYAFANDTAGNTNQTDVRTIRIDTTAPNITVLSPLNSTYYGSLPFFMNVSVNENASSCWFRLDAGSNSSMVSLNTTYYYNSTSPGQGLHNVTFYCNDTVGNIGQSQLYYFSIDTIPPVVTLNQPIQGYNTSSTTVIFNCSATDNVALRNVSLYGNWSGWGAKSTNSSGLNNTNYLFNLTLPEGDFAWNCLACDNTNCSFAASNRTLTVDTTNPTLSVQLPPDGKAYNTTTIPLNYTVSDIHLANCWYYNESINISLASCANTTFNQAAEGNHYLIVYSNDTAGNLASVRVNYSVDLVKPTVSVQSPVIGTIYNTTNAIDLNYTARDSRVRDSCWYILDAGAPVIISGCLNTTLTGLSNSNHSLSVYANDTAGNSNFTSLTFIINVTGMVVSIVSPLNSTYWNTTAISVNATTNRPATKCNYTLDGGASITMTNTSSLNWNATVTSLSEGLHNITFNCTDGSIYGNSSRSFFRIDLTTPSIAIGLPQNNSRYNRQNVTLNYTATDANPLTCSYSVDAGSYSALANCANTTMTLLSDGVHNVSVRATDAAGNSNSSLVRFYVDTIAPTLTIISPQNITYPYQTISFNASGSENLSSCWFNIDSIGNNSLTQLNITYFYNTSIVEDGSHNVTFYCNDTAGNTGSSLANFTVDTTGPIVTFVPPTPGDGGVVDVNSTYINITLNEPGSVAILEFNYNNGTVTNYTMASSGAANWFYNVTFLPDRTYNYRVFVNDTWNNRAVSPLRSVQVVTVGPAVTLINPQYLNYTTNYLPMNVSANTPIREWRYSINGRANQTFSPNTSIAALMGNNNLTVFAIDMNGMSGSASVSFNVSGMSWYDDFDQYSGMNSTNNTLTVNSTARINFCWSAYYSEGCWPYRKNLTISGSTGALSGYQVRLNLNLTNESIYGKLNSSCKDLRFSWFNTTSGVEGDVPYYIESCNLTGGNVSLFVKVPLIPTTGTSIMMYYGNLEAANRSNGTATFEFFDDFSAVSTSVWGANGVNWASLGGISWPTASMGSSTITSTYTTPNSYATELRLSSNSSSGFAGYYRFGSTTNKLTLYLDPVNGRVSLNNGTDNYAYINSSAMQTYTIISDFGSNSYKLYLNHNSTAAISLTTPDTGSTAKPVFYSYYASGLFLDWLGIRKYSSTEPALSSMAAEQISPNNATIPSIVINPGYAVTWQTFRANISSIPAGTNASFSIIDGTSGGTLYSCNYTTAQAGCDISSISATSVYIQTRFTTTTPGTTPALSWYNISWTTSTNQIDLRVLGMNFSKQDAVEGELIQVSVNVSNSGSGASGNFTLELNISLYNNTYSFDQRLLQNITSLAGGNSTLATFNWTAKVGTYMFSAYADIFSNITETNETNNNLTRNYTTSAWYYVDGKYNYNIELKGVASTFQNWSAPNLTGNIYYSDADSVYNPSDLRPLNGTNYLALADLALGMGYFNDSLRRLYDMNNDSWPDNFANMTIAGVSYLVPIINSTNSSTFITGLMFDSADGATYTGAQDLVFVTMLNQSKQGKFGVYDYEARLPSKLATLKPGTSQILRMDEVN